MAELPSGTVTFLLTDVEGSTAPWEATPEGMRAALVDTPRVLVHKGTFNVPCGRQR